MNLERINQLAADADLTNYEGESGNAYTGFSDDLVDFGGDGLSFATEIASARIFTMNFVNSHTAVKTALICPSYSPSLPAGNANGAPVTDGAFVTISGVTATASGSPKTIANLLAFVDKNPTRLLAIKLTSNSTAQLAQQITVLRKSPFRNLEDEIIDIASFTRETNNNDKMVTINLVGRNIQFDNQTEIQLPLAAESTCTVTLYFGAVLNTASGLNRKSKRAGSTPAVANSRAMIAAAK